MVKRYTMLVNATQTVDKDLKRDLNGKQIANWIAVTHLNSNKFVKHVKEKLHCRIPVQKVLKCRQ